MRVAHAGLLAAFLAFPHLAFAQQNVADPKTLVGSDAVAMTVRLSSRGDSWIAETENLRLRWSAPESELRALAETSERLLRESKASWLGSTRSLPWTPSCEIVVHCNSNDYVACLGPHSAQTSGCSTIRLDQGHVVGRRIDLCAEAPDWRTESLPHELTHVVLADRFSTCRISPWADEGIAMLAETCQMRDRRLKALRQVIGGGATYTVRDLMGVKAFPQPAFRIAFYGQSVALVSLLLQWGTRQQLLEFVEASQSQGPDAALAAVYGNRSMAELEQQLAASCSSNRFETPTDSIANSTALQTQATAAVK
jgi:hypothetical protein